MTKQGGEGLRGPTVVAAGASFQIEVAPNEGSVNVTDNSGVVTSHTVTTGKSVTLQAPSTGGYLTITVGTGNRKRLILIKVVAPSP